MPTLQLNRLSLGVASTAPQIEGGRVDHSWMDWADRGHIRDGSSPARANDHYRRFSEDAALMESQGMRDYRFGVGRARIEPEPGQFDDSALVHYREKLLDLQARGIRPQLTLHHFANPMWFERMGAFTRLKNVPHFLRFVEHTVRALCDRISEYITTNEPNVYATNGYFFGAWPPGEASFSRTLYVDVCTLRRAHRRLRVHPPRAPRAGVWRHARRVCQPSARVRTEEPAPPATPRGGGAVGTVFPGQPVARCDGRTLPPPAQEPVCSKALPLLPLSRHQLLHAFHRIRPGGRRARRRACQPPVLGDLSARHCRVRQKRCASCCRCRSTSRKTALATATTAAAAAICSTTCRRFATAAYPWSTTITGAFATTLSGWKAKARALPRARGLCHPAPNREAQRAILRRNDPCPRRDGSGIQSLCRAVRVPAERGPQMITAEGHLLTRRRTG